MLVYAFDAADLQELLALAGLLFGAIGAILWFGALTLPRDEVERVQAVATGFGVLSPVLLAWPLLYEIGVIAWWMLIAFFVLSLLDVTLTRFCLSRSIASRRPDNPVPAQEDAQRAPAVDNEKEPEITTDEAVERHPATLGAGPLSAGEKSLANAAVAIAVGLMLLARGLRMLTKDK